MAELFGELGWWKKYDKGYSIDFYIDQSAVGLELPAHPLGHVPFRVDKLLSNIVVDFKVDSADEKGLLVLNFNNSGGVIRLYIE